MLQVAKALSHMLNHVLGRSNRKLGRFRLELAAATMNSALPVTALLMVGGVDLSVDVEPLHVVPESVCGDFVIVSRADGVRVLLHVVKARRLAAARRRHP